MVKCVREEVQKAVAVTSTEYLELKNIFRAVLDRVSLANKFSDLQSIRQSKLLQGLLSDPILFLVVSDLHFVGDSSIK